MLRAPQTEIPIVDRAKWSGERSTLVLHYGRNRVLYQKAFQFLELFHMLPKFSIPPCSGILAMEDIRCEIFNDDQPIIRETGGMAVPCTRSM